MRPRKKQRNLPPCVYQKHGSFWYVKGGRWTRLGTTLKSSLERYAALQDAPKGEMPALIDKVLAHIGPNLAPSTRTAYASAAKRLKAMLVEFSPRDVRPCDVAGIKVALADTPNFANRCLSVLRDVFSHAVEWQLVDSNPCLGIQRHAEAKRGRYVTDDELAALRSKSGPRLRVIIDLCYLTGQRINDVLAIRRADLTAKGIGFKQKKTGTTLTVAWTPDLERVVAEAKGLYGNLVALTLLHGATGKRPDYSAVRLQFETAAKAAGIADVRLHDLRAKSLTDAKNEGKDATALAGHASAAMTERYIRLRESPVVNGPSFRQALDN